MADVPGSERDLQAIYEKRKETRQGQINIMNEIDAAIHGQLPTKYNDLWGEEAVRLEIRLIKTADYTLRGAATKEFPIVVTPNGNGEKPRQAAERVEKIAYGWNNGASLVGGQEMDGVMSALALHQVRFSDGAMCIYPDYNRKLVFMHARDPRIHFPPLGWTPWSPQPLNDTMFVYDCTLGELKERYEGAAAQLNESHAVSKFGPGGSFIADDAQKIQVCEFFSRDAWYICTLGGKFSVQLVKSESGDRGHPGVCPVVAFTQLDPDPVFAGQLGLEAAMQKILAQEVESTDQTLHGPIFHSKLVGDVMRWDQPNLFDTTLGDKPFAMRLAPDSPGNLERSLGMLISLARLANFNPESMQGGGDANSAKAIHALQAGPRSLVQDILWRPFFNGFPRVYDICLDLEMNLWPNERKKAYGARNRGKEMFEVEYTPSAHLEGFRSRIKIEPGFGLGGYQATLEGLQKQQSGAISMRTLRELDPSIRDAEMETRRVEAESVERIADALIEARGPSLSLAGVAKWKRYIDEGMSKFDALQKVSDEGLLEPQPDPAAAPPGIPPEMAALMGGGPEQAALPPAGVL